MLIGIDQLLSGELLHALDEMGHGDALTVVDANFPAGRLASRPVIRLVGVDAPAAVRAILTVFPIDSAEDVAIMRSPSGTQPVQEEILRELPPNLASEAIQVERHDFYQLSREAAVIVQTGDSRPYANVLMHKAGINRITR